MNYRHNNVRDSVAEYLRLVTKDVRIEPLFTPIESANFQQKGNNADKARLNIYQQEECGAHLRGLFLTCTFSIQNRLYIRERPCHSSTLCMRRRKRTST